MRRKIIISAVAMIVGLVGGGFAFLPESASKTSAALSAPVPITAATADVKDVPVYLTGLGTVQAFNTVTVNTRVDGQLDKVNFTEGQGVKAGDVLAQIDPRPFQAALDHQLEATVQADQANIDAAQVQLGYTSIKATPSGRTGIRLVDQGNIVHATSTTGRVVITQLQPISVVFTLPQDQLQEVIHQMTSTSTPLQV